MQARHLGAFTLLLISILGIAAGPAMGQVPTLFTYQGVLKDDGGTALPDATYTMDFNLYEVDVGGTAVWSEQLGVPVADGVFSVILGEINTLDPVPFDRPYWLGIAVSGEAEMTPRIQLTSAPYSLQAETVTDEAITSSKIADGTVVRSLYGLRDDIDLIAGSNIMIEMLGNGLMISSTGGSTADLDWATYGNNLSMIPHGSVGIGSTAPPGVLGRRSLHVADGLSPSLVLEQTGEVPYPYARWSLSTTGLFGSLVFSYMGGPTGDGPPLATIMPNGNFGIGDLGPTSRLSVLGGNSDLDAGEGDVRIGNASYRLKVGVDLDGPGAGDVFLRADGGTGAMHLGTQNYDIMVLDDEEARFYNATGNRTAVLAAQNGAGDVGGQLQLFRPNGTLTVELDGNEDGDGSNAGVMAMYTSAGTRTVYIEGQENSSTQGSQILMYDYSGQETIEMDADWGSNGGAGIAMRAVGGNKTIELDAMENDNPTQGSSVKLYNGAGELTIELDADWGGIAEGRVITEVLEITGGSDLSEQFEVNSAGAEVEPGTVLCIDTDRPGELKPSEDPYDFRVAGVVSGAGGVRPGMLMGQSGSVADGEHPVALTGRVYVRADASGGPIVPGDLLTTSSVPGHAMKVADHGRANGAILGKAMTGLDEGQGLVLVLVSLQ